MNPAITNDVINTILGRYSIRQFTDRSISQDVQEILLACGFSAPSGVNLKPCHISVVQKSKLFVEINQEIVAQGKKLEGYSSYFLDPQYNIMASASLFFMISANPDGVWYQYDAGLIAGNINLAAESLGIGACLLGFAQFLFVGDKADYFRQRLHIPQGNIPLFGMILGYKDKQNQSHPREASLNTMQKKNITYIQ